MAYFVHKFRSTIGKSKQIRHGDKVLVATSGGASSAAMLHLIRQGLNETSHKQLRFEPAFLYVDGTGEYFMLYTNAKFIVDDWMMIIVKLVFNTLRK